MYTALEQAYHKTYVVNQQLLEKLRPFKRCQLESHKLITLHSNMKKLLINFLMRIQKDPTFSYMVILYMEMISSHKKVRNSCQKIGNYWQFPYSDH